MLMETKTIWDRRKGYIYSAYVRSKNICILPEIFFYFSLRKYAFAHKILCLHLWSFLFLWDTSHLHQKVVHSSEMLYIGCQNVMFFPNTLRLIWKVLHSSKILSMFSQKFLRYIWDTFHLISSFQMLWKQSFLHHIVPLGFANVSISTFIIEKCISYYCKEVIQDILYMLSFRSSSKNRLLFLVARERVGKRNHYCFCSWKLLLEL